MARAKGLSLAFMAALYICVIQEAGGATFVIQNQCNFTVWAASSRGGGKRLDTGQSWTPQIPANSTAVTFWGRTGCSFNGSGVGSCSTGDCGGLLNCTENVLGTHPITLAEYNYNSYDISLVDGFNLPMSIIPSNSNCTTIACNSNITANCPPELRVSRGCKSACDALGSRKYCCQAGNTDNLGCSSTNYSKYFNGYCSQAKTYEGDSDNTFNCTTGTNYTVLFCGANRYMNKRPVKISSSLLGIVIVGASITGALILAMALMVWGIPDNWKKLRTKKHRNQDHLTIMVPNSTKSRTFTLEEIVESTQNFNQKIGQGGFGSVFLGKLLEGPDIAVKVLSLFSIEGVHQFQNEVDLLSKIHHKNLVSLLGFCNESKEVMLIYEYMSEGSLRDHLYGSRAQISPLNWKTRLKIALDAAQGLEYLHMGCTPKIIHRDVKTANILLDGNMNGKLADFGLSRMSMDGESSYANTAVKGTIGYLDPEYFRTQMLTEKSDVYSFGVVLLEMICGRPPINANLCEEELNLIQWVTPHVKMGDIEVIIDKRLDGNYDIISIAEVAEVALKCVEAVPASRPSVCEVVTQIKETIIRENENNCHPPISDGVSVEHRDLQRGNFHTRAESIPRKMQWADNSSNLSQVGR